MLKLFNRNKKTLFDCLYNQYSEQLYLLILRYVVSQFDAEEVLQRGFIKVYEGLGQFKFHNNKATLAWLNRIMVNESLMFLREQKRLSASYEDHLSEPEIIQHPDVESELAYESCLKLVRNLPDGYRTVFNLYVIEGYSHKEISEMLKVSESASRSQLTRARSLLKEQLKSTHYEIEHV
ncbi:MAG: sigma-70 family RNA polymerase sigma factor [Carboxylicivirga sp.]|jgi:RNA polymerase sigma-70 factor (ECF subfamily)|nr:sigma-70 family RNA polymerase sigma factor [Carboxylicivirga sp.]